MKIRNEREAEILRLHRVEGWPVGTIARELGVHASTVRRVLGQAGELAVARAQRPSIVDPYLPASRLHAMVRARGYPGGESHFRDIIAAIRLFAGSDAGAERAVIICSVIESAKLHGIEPFEYLRDVLDKLGSGWPMRRLDELMPDRWAAAHGIEPPPSRLTALRDCA